MDRIVTACWIAILAAVLALLAIPETRAVFEETTRAHPYALGVLKIGLLGMMGELLGKRIRLGRWQLRGIRLWQRALIWGLLGIAFAAVFPLFSFGVEGMLKAGLLPGLGSALATAFWKSFFTNLLFGFQMMVFHRITDTLIERDQLLGAWPLVEVFAGIDWKGMFRVVGASCLWFWVPAHTVTFMLPPEYRVLCAAFLAIALGFIMGLVNRKAVLAVMPG